jgi:hypothetical protein
MQGATREANEAPGIGAAEEREAAEAACRANPASCLQVGGDPHWIWSLTIKQSEELAGAIVAGEGYLTLTGLTGIFKHIVGVDFAVQVEELIEKDVLGVSRGEVESWADNLAENLGGCNYAALTGSHHPNNPHCWVYITTQEYRWGFTLPALGFIGVIFEFVDFAKDAQVAYCPRGSSQCYAT